MISQQRSTSSTPALADLKHAPAASSRVRIARRAYVVGVYLLGLSVLAQFLLAGLGIFFDPNFLSLWHATVGASVIAALSLLLVVVGRLGRVPGRTLWLTAAVFGLVVVQSLLLLPYHMDATGLLRAVSGLHVVNALLIAWVALRLVTRASSLRFGSGASAQSTG